MIYSIVLYGEPVLEKQAATVTEFDTPELHKLIEDMFESMYAAKGVGLGGAADRHREADRRDRSCRWPKIRRRRSC